MQSFGGLFLIGSFIKTRMKMSKHKMLELRTDTLIRQQTIWLQTHAIKFSIEPLHFPRHYHYSYNHTCRLFPAVVHQTGTLWRDLGRHSASRHRRPSPARSWWSGCHHQIPADSRSPCNLWRALYPSPGQNLDYKTTERVRGQWAV